MSAPIKPFELDNHYAGNHQPDNHHAEYDDHFTSITDASEAARSMRFRDLEGDDLFAPADLSETSIGPVPMRVRTLTNSPRCMPAALGESDADTADGSAPSMTSTTSATSTTSTDSSEAGTSRPIRRVQSVRADAWAVPAPANWGRTRRAVGMRKVAAPSNHSPRQARSRVARAQSPSSDWALPF